MDIGITQIAISLILLVTLASLTRLIAVKMTKFKRPIPDVAILLFVGMTVNVLYSILAKGNIAFWMAPLQNTNLLSAAAALIICYGGAELHPRVFRTIWRPVTGLATIGVIASTCFIGLLTFGLHLGELPFATALLLGAVLSGTDPAVLVSTLEQVRVPERVREMLIGESALNDPTSALLASALLTFLYSPTISLSTIVAHSVEQAVLAIIIGLIVGMGVRMLQRRKWLNRPLISLLIVFFVSLVLSKITGANIYLTTFIAGFAAQPLDAGIHITPHPQSVTASIKWIHEWLMVTRSYIFLMLGLTINLQFSSNVITGLWIAILLVVIVRPASVWIVRSIMPRHMTTQEATFFSLNRQSGIMPALYASILIHAHIPHAHLIQWSVTLTIILTSVILLPFFETIAKRCGLSTRAGSIGS